MGMILTRHEFRMWVKLREPRFYKWNSPAWTHEPKKYPSQWFVKVKPINVSQTWKYKKDYWAWWGFTNKDDIALWMLKWT
jgi:hypothetical protein